MIWFDPRATGIPGLTPPEILVCLRIPKTAGSTMESVFDRCLSGAAFHGHIPAISTSALLIRPTVAIGELFHQLPPDRRKAVRCLVDEHVTLDIATLFDRPVRFFTILRHPVDRVISSFYYIRTKSHLVSYPFIKDLSFEEYLDSRIGLDSDNHQVRVLSGCPELDAPWDPQGRPISTPPVERRHLEMAMHNIEERFIVAAALEQFTSLVWFFKRLYGWPLHRVLFRRQKADTGRPPLERVSAATRQRLAEMNRYDIELHEWVRERFAQQIRPLEPSFSREVRRFEMLNTAAQEFYRTAPDSIRRLATQRLSSGQAA
jgi:Galactose-3-O-sulfotransferase